MPWKKSWTCRSLRYIEITWGHDSSFRLRPFGKIQNQLTLMDPNLYTRGERRGKLFTKRRTLRCAWASIRKMQPMITLLKCDRLLKSANFELELFAVSRFKIPFSYSSPRLMIIVTPIAYSAWSLLFCWQLPSHKSLAPHVMTSFLAYFPPVLKYVLCTIA